MIIKLYFDLIFISVQNNFYDHNKQEQGKKQKSTNNAMSNDGSSIEIIDWSNGD